MIPWKRIKPGANKNSVTGVAVRIDGAYTNNRSAADAGAIPAYSMEVLMRSINTVLLTGGITKDAETKYTGGGMAIASFALAVTDSKKVGDQWQDESHYFDCTMFGKQAEAVGKLLTKGQQVTLTGKLRQERWEKDGQKRSKVVIIVDDIILHRGKSDQVSSHNTDMISDEEIPF